LDFAQPQLSPRCAALSLTGTWITSTAIGQPFHDLDLMFSRHPRKDRDISLLPCLPSPPTACSGANSRSPITRLCSGTCSHTLARQLLLAFAGGACARGQRRVRPQFHQTHQTQLRKAAWIAESPLSATVPESPACSPR